MQASFREQYGPPEILIIKELPKPTPKHNELLVRVHCTTVNRTDLGVLTGKPYLIRAFSGLTRPHHVSTGTDFSGMVESCGSSVKDFRPGDRVFGLNDNGLGSHAEYLTIREDAGVLTIPEKISLENAVASVEGAHYALNFINKINLRPGAKVMVNGATRAIGSAAVQLLKYHDCYVTAVCATENVEKVRSFGPDRIIDFKKEDFTKDQEQYHFVFDAVGKSSFEACKNIMLPGAAYLSTELGENWENTYLPITTAIGSLFGSKDDKKRVIFPMPSNIRKSLLFIRNLLERDKFMPLIDRSYHLDQVVEAFRYVMSGQKVGNVILGIHHIDT